jgi:tetratricopeptide (TPR) repeat protein
VAIRLDPKDADAYCDRGFAYGKQGKLDEAIVDLNKAIRLEPKSGLAYSGRGLAYAEKGEYSRAVADFYKAVQNLREPWLHKEDEKRQVQTKAEVAEANKLGYKVK